MCVFINIKNQKDSKHRIEGNKTFNKISVGCYTIL